MIKRLCRKLILSYPFNQFFSPLAFSFPSICHIPSIFCSKPYWGYLCRTKRLDEYTSAWLLRHDITVLHFVSSHVNTSSIQNRMSRLYLRWSNDKWTSQAKCSWSCAIHLKALFISLFILFIEELILTLEWLWRTPWRATWLSKAIQGFVLWLDFTFINQWLTYLCNPGPHMLLTQSPHSASRHPSAYAEAASNGAPLKNKYTQTKVMKVKGAEIIVLKIYSLPKKKPKKRDFEAFSPGCLCVFDLYALTQAKHIFIMARLPCGRRQPYAHKTIITHDERAGRLRSEPRGVKCGSRPSDYENAPISLNLGGGRNCMGGGHK